jgi:hypothetical protein
LVIGKCRGVTITFSEVRQRLCGGHNLFIPHPPMGIGLNPLVFWVRLFSKAVLLFHVFFLSCTLQNFTKNVDRWTNIKNSKKTI